MRRGKRAFTLLELILVMALLALSAAMVYPSLSKFARHRRAMDAAADLLALTRYAQDQAACEGVPYRLRVDPATGGYWLEAQRTGAFAPLSTNLGRTMSLPDGVTAAWEPPTGGIGTSGGTTTNTTGKTGSDPGTNGVEFDPDGGHDAAVLRLTDRDGNAVRIDGGVSTEPFHVSELAPGQEVETP